MNTRVLSTVIIIVVVALGGIFFFKNRKNIDPATEPKDLDGLYSVGELLKLSQNMQCDFSKSEDGAEVKGTIFTSEGRVRGDFDIDTGGSATVPQKFESHFIMRDGFIYTWTSLLKSGFRSVATSEASSQAGVVDIYDDVKYDCKSAQEDRDAFNIPPDITFTALQ